MNGKIAHLPQPIQEQLNRRLDEGQETKPILDWLNSLPEVQVVLKAEFEGVPISQQNLSQHTTRSYLDWQARQQALEFAASFKADDSALQSVLPDDLADKLSRWVTIRYAALTRTLSSEAEPDKELRHLRNLSLFILALRRGEFNAKRLLLETQRLNIELSDTAEAKEKEFWQWTKRPDIHAKLFPDLDPDSMRRSVIRLLDRELLGSPSQEAEETADPAILI